VATKFDEVSSGYQPCQVSDIIIVVVIVVVVIIIIIIIIIIIMVLKTVVPYINLTRIIAREDFVESNKILISILST
jgi:type IV secretory pathway component VirB8